MTKEKQFVSLPSHLMWPVFVSVTCQHSAGIALYLCCVEQQRLDFSLLFANF